MNKNSKVLILGSRGLVGSAIKAELTARGYTNLLTPVREELDLLNQQQVLHYFSSYKPEYVFFHRCFFSKIYILSRLFFIFAV
jgi:GDP-L-fucose synthase